MPWLRARLCAQGEDSLEGRPSTAEERARERQRRLERVRLLDLATPSEALYEGAGLKVASLGWIVALRLPSCQVEVRAPVFLFEKGLDYWHAPF